MCLSGLCFEKRNGPKAGRSLRGAGRGLERRNRGMRALQLKKRRSKQYAACSDVASPARFERAAFRLGEPLNICHLCSPMYRKVAIRQAFFVFRVAPCSSKFTGVVRCSPVHFSSFLDFSKKGNKNIFYLPPILAHFRVKIHLQSNRKPKRNISRLPEKHSLGKTIKKRVLHSRFE